MNVLKSFLLLFRWALVLGVVIASGDVAARAQDPPVSAWSEDRSCLDEMAFEGSASATGSSIREAALDDETPGWEGAPQPGVISTVGITSGGLAHAGGREFTALPAAPVVRLVRSSAQARGPPRTQGMTRAQPQG